MQVFDRILTSEVQSEVVSKVDNGILSSEDMIRLSLKEKLI